MLLPVGNIHSLIKAKVKGRDMVFLAERQGSNISQYCDFLKEIDKAKYLIVRLA